MTKKGFAWKFGLFFLCATLLSLLTAYFTGALSPHPLPLPIKDTVTASVTAQMTVILDAGHGGEDGGTSSAEGLVEKDVNLKLALLLRDLLEANGIKVVMSREEDKLLYDRTVNYQGRKKKLDFAARLKLIEETPNALLVSIHMNAFSDPRYSGLQVWYSQNNSRSVLLADLIQSQNKAMLQPENNRKTKGAGSTIYLLDKAKCPAVLVECGFLSNPAEAARFETAEYRQKVAFMLFCAVTEFLEAEY